MTQKEIAEILGVSQGTVSLALNHPESSKVSPQIREKIIRFCRERKLGRTSHHQTWNIGFLVNEPCFREDLFYHPILEGVERGAGKFGYSLVLELYNEHQPVKMVKYQKVDGIVLMAGSISPRQAKVLAGKPVALCNTFSDQIACDVVLPDDQAVMLLAFRHLYELGHRRIAHFAMLSQRSDTLPRAAERRAQSFLHAAALFGTPDDLLFQRKIEVPGFSQTHLNLLSVLAEALNRQEPPTAIIAGDNYLNILRPLLMERGIRVPQDISLLGIDNTDRFNQVSPFLSSVDMRFDFMGHTAVELLHERIMDPRKPFEKILYEPELVLRKSTAPPAEPGTIRRIHEKNRKGSNEK